TVTVFAVPEESLANNEFRQCGTIFALGRFAHLLAKSLKRRIVDRLWRGDRDDFVGGGFSGWLRLASLVLRNCGNCADDQQCCESQTKGAHRIVPGERGYAHRRGPRPPPNINTTHRRQKFAAPECKVSRWDQIEGAHDN